MYQFECNNYDKKSGPINVSMYTAMYSINIIIEVANILNADCKNI